MTTYIESKLNPDGTYNHSEVIEAHKNGARIQAENTQYEGDWYSVGRSINWFDYVKYRAVIEDKPVYKDLGRREDQQFFDGLNDQNSKRLLVVPAVNLAAHVRDKFQSGNAIPVERITLTRAEVNEVFPGLLK